MIIVAIKWYFQYIKHLVSVSPLNWQVSFTELHTSQKRFFPPHGLDLPSASTLGNNARTRWSLKNIEQLYG